MNNFDNMSVSELISYITETYHIPLRKNIEKLDFLMDIVNTSFLKKYPEFFSLGLLYEQFKNEILAHVTREDIITFPTILKFEEIYNNQLINISNNFDLLNEFVNEAQLVNQHAQFNLYLTKLIRFIDWFILSGEKTSDIDMIRSILKNLQNDNIIHSQIENKDLYFKWIELQNKLKNKLEEVKKNLN